MLAALEERGGEAAVPLLERVLRRPGMSEEKLSGIRSQQWPDAAKRRAADFVITTGRDRRYTRHAVSRVLTAIVGARGRCAVA